MAENGLPGPDAADEVVRVTRVYNVAGGATREEPKFTVARTGRCSSNTEAKDELQRLVRDEGQNWENIMVTTGGVESKGLLYVYAGKPGEAGLTNAQLYKNSVSFHAGGAFREMPGLRPTSKVECKAVRAKDSKGEPCLIIHVGAGTPVRSMKRKKKEADEAADD